MRGVFYMKIAFFEISNIEKDKFEKAFPKEELQFFEETLQDVEIQKYIESDAICVFVHSEVNQEILGKMPNLKLIATRSTGTDHINLDACKERNIEVKNVPLYGENTVAEHTFALMLSLSRKIHKSYVRSIQGKFTTEGLQGFDLKDKTLGIIGGGRIGLHVARIARSFGMHVRVYDIHKDTFLAELINFKYVSLDELLETSDIVSLHVPLNKYTEHMINTDSLIKFKDGSLLINTARGGLVDTPALIDALKNGKLAGAGLDVIEGEEYLIEENIFNSPVEKAAKLIVESKQLLDNENVVLTPHNAFNSVEAVNRIIDTSIDNIKTFIEN
ncbi:MAG: hydroxyacid dehydrogenase [Clostridia bacterium]|nr:hydroxyacid dehydrogenase [Clostridia bacterium]